jgi:hypothetical protein
MRYDRRLRLLRVLKCALALVVLVVEARAEQYVGFRIVRTAPSDVRQNAEICAGCCSESIWKVPETYSLRFPIDTLFSLGHRTRVLIKAESRY